MEFTRRQQQYKLEITTALKDNPDVIDVIVSTEVEFDQDRLVVGVVFANLVTMSFNNDEWPSPQDVVSMFESVR